jgi:hypothetical protein
MLDKLAKLLEEQGGKQVEEKERDEWDEEIPAPTPKAAGGTGGSGGGIPA